METVITVVAFAGVLGGLFMWFVQTLRHRSHLAQCVQDLQRQRRLDRRLTGCVNEMERILDRTPRQTSDEQVPEELVGHAHFLFGLRREAADNALQLSRHAVRLRWPDGYLGKVTLAGRRCEVAHGALVTAFQALADATREYERGWRQLFSIRVTVQVLGLCPVPFGYSTSPPLTRSPVCVRSARWRSPTQPMRASGGFIRTPRLTRRGLFVDPKFWRLERTLTAVRPDQWGGAALVRNLCSTWTLGRAGRSRRSRNDAQIRVCPINTRPPRRCVDISTHRLALWLQGRMYRWHYRATAGRPTSLVLGATPVGLVT